MENVNNLAGCLTPAPDLALILDLPGDQAVRLSLALASRGFRPVPLIDGSPGSRIPSIFPNLDVARPTSPGAIAVDMRQTLRWLRIGAERLNGLKISANASPVFLLDALRIGFRQNFGPEVFDNRWKTFPQDFPSARFLLEHGIRRILLIQDSIAQPTEDFAHVLLRWQEDGLAIFAASATAIDAPILIMIRRPSQFRALWYRALALLGLRRASAGGFGAWPHGSGGGRSGRLSAPVLFWMRLFAGAERYVRGSVRFVGLVAVAGCVGL
jgi:hypothetical protein